MSEGYVNLFANEHEGTNRPHFKGYIKIEGVDHEFALWPNKDGKKGYSGKYKPKQEPSHGLEQNYAPSEPRRETVETGALPEEKIPF